MSAYSHASIHFNHVGFSVTKKICFSGFSTTLQYGQRIALAGPNGCGKSSLLKILLGIQEPSEGHISIPQNAKFGYVEQISAAANISGGQIFHKKLTEALASKPNVLCLDEPTNHLDAQNRKSFLRMLEYYPHTLLIASHDVDLISLIPTTIWAITEEKIHVFNGRYSDYIREIRLKEAERQRIFENAHREKRRLQDAIDFERKRTAHGKKRNKKTDCRILRGVQKMWGQNTHGKNLAKIEKKLQTAENDIQSSYSKASPKLSFKLENTKSYSEKILIYIREGCYGYGENVLVENLHFQLSACDRVAIQGPNASGKSTFFKALINHPAVTKNGKWQVSAQIGYLDQHYSTLPDNACSIEIIEAAQPNWSNSEIRYYLNTFLFSKNEEVNKHVCHLSGGEKARLALAHALIKSPSLILLDEITNNIDLHTREYIVGVLNDYTGALLVISHEESFLAAINILDAIDIRQFSSEKRRELWRKPGGTFI